MSFYRQDDCENWKWSKVSKSSPSDPVKETDALGFVYANKPDEVIKNGNYRVSRHRQEHIS